MRAEMADGRVIALPKDCGCITHNGPHWVHADDEWRNRNLDLLRTAENPAVEPMRRFFARRGFAAEECARLAGKEAIMRSKGIARIIREPCDELSDVEKARVKAHFADVSGEARRAIDERNKTPDDRRRERIEAKAAKERESRVKI